MAPALQPKLRAQFLVPSPAKTPPPAQSTLATGQHSTLPMTSLSIDGFAKTTKYSDFAKCTTDFFAKDFPSGQVKVEARTSPRSLFAGAAKGARPESFCDVPQPFAICNLTSGQEFKVVSCRDLETGAISAEVRSTSTFSIGGKVDAKSVTSLSTGNAMCQQLTLYNPLIEGLKLDLSGSLQPSGGLGAGKLGIEWVQPAVHASTYLESLKSPSPAPLITSDISTRLRDIQLGLDFAYSPLSQSVERYSVGILLDRPREKIALQAAQGFSAFTAAYHQRFTEQLEVAYKAAWSVKTAALDMEVGARYNLFSGGFVKAKVDNAGKLGVAFASDLRQGVQLTLGASIDTNSLTENKHKVGLDLVYSA